MKQREEIYIKLCSKSVKFNNKEFKTYFAYPMVKNSNGEFEHMPKLEGKDNKGQPYFYYYSYKVVFCDNCLKDAIDRLGYDYKPSICTIKAGDYFITYDKDNNGKIKYNPSDKPRKKLCLFKISSCEPFNEEMIDFYEDI